MGFINKMFKSITGGWADINLQINEGKRGQELPLKVFIQNKNETISYSSIYVKIRAVEEIKGYSSGTCHRCNGTVSVNVQDTYVVYENKFILKGADSIQPNQTLELEGKINIPDNLFATYYGQNARLIYEVMAGIDMQGNDPDSGWHELKIL